MNGRSLSPPRCVMDRPSGSTTGASSSDCPQQTPPSCLSCAASNAGASGAYYSLACACPPPIVSTTTTSSSAEGTAEEPPRKKKKRSHQPPAQPRFYSPPTGAGTGFFRPVSFDSRVGQSSRRFSFPSADQRPLPIRPINLHSLQGNGAQQADTSSDKDDHATYSKDGIFVFLQDAKLWHSFHRHLNEMIVTKPGRRLFPSPMVSIRGLKPQAMYAMSLRLQSTDRYRYKFHSQRWERNGESEVDQEESKQIYRHPNSPKTGLFWMKKPVSFKPCKVTHNQNDNNGHLQLHTMHKYVMMVVVTELEAGGKRETSIPLDITTFVAVTAYQNSHITQLKINHNPFAKGFREKDIVPVTYTHQFVPPTTHEFVAPPTYEFVAPLPSMSNILPAVAWPQPQLTLPPPSQLLFEEEIATPGPMLTPGPISANTPNPLEGTSHTSAFSYPPPPPPPPPSTRSNSSSSPSAQSLPEYQW